jgi:membrane protein implicated in regulation of membrane protease activity
MTGITAMRAKAPTMLGFLGWLVVGAGGAIGMLAILTIGIFVLPCAALLAAFLTWRGYGRLAAPSLLTGSGLALLYVAFLNRDGPGTTCTTSGASQTCTQEMSPWPWLVVGLLLASAGITLAGAALSRSRRAG